MGLLHLHTAVYSLLRFSQLERQGLHQAQQPTIKFITMTIAGIKRFYGNTPQT